MVRSQASDAFIRIGMPMFILVTGGSLLLSHLLQGKFDIKVLNHCSPYDPVHGLVSIASLKHRMLVVHQIPVHPWCTAQDLL